MADQVFPEGIRVFAPKTQYSKGALVIDVNDLFNWLKGDGKQHLTEYNGKKQLKLQLAEGKSGGWYAKVDTWKPEEKKNPAGQKNNSDDDNDAPF